LRTSLIDLKQFGNLSAGGLTSGDLDADERSMLTEFERPLTDAERARLAAQLTPRHVGPVNWGLPGRGEILAWCVVSLVLVIVKPPVGWLFAAIYPLFFFLPRWIRAQMEVRRADVPFKRQHDQARAAIAAASTVRVQRVESRAVVAVDCYEAMIYLFDLGDGRTFWHGVMPDDRVDPAQWPNKCFEVVHVPGSKESFGPFCEGEALEPRERLEYMDLGDLPESGVIDRSLEEFLRRSAAPASPA
jgi:hypothetical protein